MAVDNSLTSATAATASVAADFTLPLDNTDDTVTYPQISSNDDKTKDSIDPSGKDTVNLFCFHLTQIFHFSTQINFLAHIRIHRCQEQQ